jgi:hypothetical protein
MPVSLTRVLPLVLALAACASCGPASGPDGGVALRGGDATFNFSWRIDGQDPAGPGDPCTAAGVRFIRMTVVDDADPSREYEGFRFDCHLGRYRSPAPELRAGIYRLYWEAVAADGSRVSLASGTFRDGVRQPTLEHVVVERGAHVDFDAGNRPDTSFPGAPTNFATGRGPLEVALEFAATPGASTGASCAAAGVERVTWTLRLSNNVAIDLHTTREACAAGYGALRWDALDFDRYMLEVRGYDAAGREGWRGRCGDLLVARGVSSTPRRCLVDRVTP